MATNNYHLKCHKCGKEFKSHNMIKYCSPECRRQGFDEIIKARHKEEAEAEELKRIKLLDRMRNGSLSEDAKEAAALGLEYGLYRAYKENGYLEQYKKIKFHEASERNSDDVIVEKSWIGNAHGHHVSGGNR